MAFHVACPITCRRICYCTLGFPANLQSEKARRQFENEVERIEEFLKDPWGIRALGHSTVQVSVPKVVVTPSPPPPQPQPQPQPQPTKTINVVVAADGDGGGGGSMVDEAAEAVSERAKTMALQKKAAAAVVAAEDYARRFESGDKMVVSKDATGEVQDLANGNVMCRMCFVGENEGSERARKMLSCNSCGKKYHRHCLKSWSQHRDLFHWSSWSCPSCRTCEVPNYVHFLYDCSWLNLRICFVRRSLGHIRNCFQKQESMFAEERGIQISLCSAKDVMVLITVTANIRLTRWNVSSGPYLCPKHTKCHSCASTVPGNGLSVRWFLGYTCCDACGRLFVKGNYCPVCLKVYRDSESTPMVCCDICQRWVHCHCDGISDARYHQFQVDENLKYKCATCRGECYQVKDVEDAVQELWRRRDKADQDLIVSLRAAAGLPTQEDIFSISPYSDDEENGHIPKNESGRSIKLSLKGVSDHNSPKKIKDHGKKYSNKKHGQKKDQIFEAHHNVQFLEKTDISFPVAGIVNHTEGISAMNQPGVKKLKFVDDVMVSDEERKSRVVRFKSSKSHTLDSEDDGASNSKAVKAKKLVINLGARKITDPSNFQRENDLAASNAAKVDHSSQLKGLKTLGTEAPKIKFGKVRSDSKLGRGSSNDAVLPADNLASLRTRSTEANGATFGSLGIKVNPSSSQPVRKDAKPLLKFKLKKPSADNQNSQAPPREVEKSSLNHPLEQRSLLNYPEEDRILLKGQRSKRKRSSSFMDKTLVNEDEDADVSQSHKGGLVDEIMDASWILRKLGKDAVGKRVEVHQPSDNSWHKGVVTDFGGTSTLFVTLDNGNLKTLELGSDLKNHGRKSVHGLCLVQQAVVFSLSGLKLFMPVLTLWKLKFLDVNLPK
ncbi:hypothetical protein ACFE04_001133 [Oxalis oulophora]